MPVALQAILAGFFVAAVSANVWPLLLLSLGLLPAALVEVLFLAVFLWWAGGGGPLRAMQAARASAFRNVDLTRRQWLWGLVAAFFLAATVHASIVLLFRFVPYPVAAFRQGYDLSFIPSQPLRWVAIAISAASAAICEETGFRGFMQRPIELRYGATVAIVVSSFFFMTLHLTKAWALLGMVPIVFGAGVLLGMLAWSADSLIPGFIGHFAMDVGLFAYWWTGIAGSFSARTVQEVGVDRPFLVACFVFAVSLALALLAISKLRRSAGTTQRKLPI
ncbi:MAG: type II CAAX endopeptidase family protein [Terracidiphilus sp.]